MQFSKLQLPPQHEPAPKDHPSELAALEVILDQLEAGLEPVAVAQSVPNVTEWVAWQLGICVEYYHQQQRMEFAIACGVAAICVADEGKWAERSAANRNSLAIVMLATGNLSLAKNLCEDSLFFVGPHCPSAYACSRSLLAVIALLEGNALEAVCHYDSVFRMLKCDGQEDAFRALAMSAVSAYESARDIAGIIWCMSVIEGEAKARSACKEIFSSLDCDISIEVLISTVTKLHAFGLHDLATEFEAHYQQLQKKSGEII